MDKDTLSPPPRVWQHQAKQTTLSTSNPSDFYNLDMSFIHRVVFQNISKLIEQDLSIDSDKLLQEYPDNKARSSAMIKKIRGNIDPIELELSKTRGDLDSILFGFELNELSYDGKKNIYELPIYRNGIKTFVYKFSVDKTLDGEIIPLEIIGNVNVSVEMNVARSDADSLILRTTVYDLIVPNTVAIVKRKYPIEGERDTERYIKSNKTIKIPTGYLAIVELENNESLFTDEVGGCAAFIAHGINKKGKNVYILCHMVASNGFDPHGFDTYGLAIAHILKKHSLKKMEINVDGFFGKKETLCEVLNIVTREMSSEGVDVTHDTAGDIWRKSGADDVILDQEGFTFARKEIGFAKEPPRKKHIWTLPVTSKSTSIEIDSIAKGAIHQTTVINEQSHAISLAKRILSIQTQKKEQKPFLAIGTSWIKAYQKDEYDNRFYDPVNKLLSSLRNYCLGKGITFIDGNDADLERKVQELQQADPGCKGIVLAGESTIQSIVDTPESRNNKNIFFAGVNNTHIAVDSYIPIIEMFDLALNLYQSEQTDESYKTFIEEKYKHLGVTYTPSQRRLTFAPPATSMNWKMLEIIYKFQTFA